MLTQEQDKLGLSQDKVRLTLRFFSDALASLRSIIATFTPNSDFFDNKSYMFGQYFKLSFYSFSPITTCSASLGSKLSKN